MDFEVRRVETAEFRGDCLSDCTFSGEKFTHNRYFSRQILRCQFLKCHFEDLRMWDTVVADSVFDRCDLRAAALGGLFEQRSNRFHRVTFKGTDLRRTAWTSAEFLDCRFEDCRYGPVDFQGSRFIRCTFTGEIRDALFCDRGFREESQPPNEMEECDFTRARLILCDFRRLNLPTIKWPTSGHTIVVGNYRAFLVTALRESRDTEKVFHGMIAHRLKWAGSHQETGAFDSEELEDWLGANWKARFEEIRSKV